MIPARTGVHKLIKIVTIQGFFESTYSNICFDHFMAQNQLILKESVNLLNSELKHVRVLSQRLEAPDTHFWLLNMCYL